MSEQRNQIFLSRVILVTVLALAATASIDPVGVANAATITVNTGFDEDLDAGGTGCSLREAIIAANIDAAYSGCPKGRGADTISFAANLPAIVLSSNLPPVTSNITFVGPKAPADSDGTVVVEGSFLYRSGFEITTANVSLIRMTFQNGFADIGGAIAQTDSGTLTVDQCTFFNNFSNTLGGAIFLTNTPRLTITGSTFSDNAAGDDGGGIYVVNGLSGITLMDSNFVNNTADNGGAIFVNGPLRGLVMISHTSAVNNNASFQGGVLRAVNVDTEFALTISNSTLLDNDAGNGGVVFVNNGKVTRLSISNSQIKENDGYNSGGVFWIDSLGASSIKTTTFDANTAVGGYGGVIYTNILTGSLSFSKSDFTNNQSDIGGVIFADTVYAAKNIQITGGNFANNRAAGGSGGVMSIFGPSGSVKISGAVFDHNDASDSGGVLFLPAANLKSLSITSSTFSTNHAFTGYGGAIDLGVPSAGIGGTVAKMSISKSAFTSNGARAGGGAICADAVTGALTITGGSLFQNNSIITDMGGSSANGGALDIGSVTRLTISNSTFDTNFAASDAGALHITQLLGPASISDSRFTSNAASLGGGGAIRLDEGNLNPIKIVKTVFEDNVALVGGAVIINGARMNILSSSFMGNTTSLFGGAIYTVGPGSTLAITSSTFVANTATNDSGGALMANNTVITVSKSLFWHNTASGYGDAVYFDAGELHYNCFEGNGSSSVADGAGGNDVTLNWWNDPGGPNQGTADTYQTAGTTNLYAPWLHSRPACPPLPAP